MTYPMQAPDQTQNVSEMSSVAPAYTYRLPKSGGRPLVFQGTEIAMAMSYTPEIPYWYEINVYHSEEQLFYVAVRLFYQAENETDVVKAEEFSSLDAALTFIQTYDAGHDVRMPVLDTKDAVAAEMAAVALHLKAEVTSARHHFAGLVGELFFEIEAAGINAGR